MNLISANLASTSFSCRPPVDCGNPTNASTRMSGGQAVFENDNYRITAGDDNTVTINNKNTGETYQASGDPHVSVDGEHAFDFYGKTTFSLEDGTKVTIATTPAQGSADATLSSKVTITNGDYGVQISGVDTNKTGDLKIDEAKGYGQVLDAVVTDGNTVQENPAGKGFLGVDAQGKIHKVDQAYIDQTDLNKGGKALQGRADDAFRQLASLLNVHFGGAMSSPGCHGQDGSSSHQVDHTCHCPHTPRQPHGGGHAPDPFAQLGQLLNALLHLRPHASAPGSNCAAPAPAPCEPPVAPPSCPEPAPQPEPPVCAPAEPPPVCAPAEPPPVCAPAEPPPVCAPPEPVPCDPEIPPPVIDNGGGGDGASGGGCGGDGGGGSCGI